MYRIGQYGITYQLTLIILPAISLRPCGSSIDRITVIQHPAVGIGSRKFNINPVSAFSLIRFTVNNGHLIRRRIIGTYYMNRYRRGIIFNIRVIHSEFIGFKPVIHGNSSRIKFTVPDRPVICIIERFIIVIIQVAVFYYNCGDTGEITHSQDSVIVLSLAAESGLYTPVIESQIGQLTHLDLGEVHSAGITLAKCTDPAFRSVHIMFCRHIEMKTEKEIRSYFFCVIYTLLE